MLAVGALSLASVTGARAESLADAIALAYRSNPTLQAERAQLRALNETYVQARVGYRPQLSGSLEADYSKGAPVQNGVVGASGPEGADAAQLSLVQPLYDGGQTSAHARAAMADILAERQKLRQTEAGVLQSVIQAYVDVRRDAEALAIARENLALLQQALADTQAHVDVGEYTRTDLAQAQARLAGARSQLSNARAQLSVSRSAYRSVVGQDPAALSPEPPLPDLPATIDEALDVAAAGNPAISAAQFAERAAAARVAVARSAYRPTISLRGSYGVDGVIGPLGANLNQASRRYVEAATASVVLTQPIFTGGLNASRVRQALENQTVQAVGVDAARRQAVQAITQAWSQMRAADEVTVSSEEQVKADEVAFEGVRLDKQAGQRTTLDELNAEQELETARLALNSARHDSYVARAALLAAIGRLEVRNLAPDLKREEPETAFDRVRQAGATPWEGAIAAIDSLGAPRDTLRVPPSPVALPRPAAEDPAN